MDLARLAFHLLLITPVVILLLAITVPQIRREHARQATLTAAHNRRIHRPAGSGSLYRLPMRRQLPKAMDEHTAMSAHRDAA